MLCKAYDKDINSECYKNVYKNDLCKNHYNEFMTIVKKNWNKKNSTNEVILIYKTGFDNKTGEIQLNCKYMIKESELDDEDKEKIKSGCLGLGSGYKIKRLNVDFDYNIDDKLYILIARYKKILNKSGYYEIIGVYKYFQRLETICKKIQTGKFSSYDSIIMEDTAPWLDKNMKLTDLEVFDFNVSEYF